MSTTFSSIDDYINSFDSDTQEELQKLRHLIRTTAPDDAKETINYGMPTYRWHGNLIHFAKFKNHIGIYPGPTAIEAFRERLTAFKTSKGAIQIPLNVPFPKDLLIDIVQFNILLLQDKKGPQWDNYRAAWRDCEEFMNQLIVKANLKKDFKWGSDVYTYKGKNVIGWAGFKHFFSLWFYNGIFLEDKLQVLITASEGKTKALRQWCFSSCDEMNAQHILDYIQESIQTIDDGKEIKPKRIAPPDLEGILKETLDDDKALKIAFDRLTPGKRKDYQNYISEAKQEKTKATRLDKIKPLILEGKGLHDKYKHS